MLRRPAKLYFDKGQPESEEHSVEKRGNSRSECEQCVAFPWNKPASQRLRTPEFHPPIRILRELQRMIVSTYILTIL